MSSAYRTPSGAIMFQAQKLIAKASVASARFLVCPCLRAGTTSAPLIGLLLSRSRVPTGLHPARGRPVGAGVRASRLR